MRSLSALALMALTGCGGGGSSGTRDDFVGTWASSGSVIFTPQGMAQQSQPFSGNVTIVAGEGTSGIRVTDPNGCTVSATVSGSMATLDPNTQCTSTTPLGPVTLTVRAGTLGRSGSTASLNSSGDFTSTNSGFPATGTFAIDGRLSKK